jgi:hypothetical protein
MRAIALTAIDSRAFRMVVSTLASGSAGLVDTHHGSRPTARPEPGKDDPERAVGRTQVRAARGAPQVGQLLAQGEVLQCEVGPAAEGGPQRAKEAQEQVDHRAMMRDGKPAWPGQSPIVATVGELWVRMTSW